MKKILTFILITALCLSVVGCNNTGTKEATDANTTTEKGEESQMLDFDTWANQQLTYPDWAQSLEYTITADNPYGPRGARFTYTLDEAKEVFRQTRYLVENLSYSDETPIYYRWKLNLASDAFLFGEYHISYLIAKEFADMEEGTVVYKYKRKGEEIVYTIDDHGYRNLAKAYVFSSMVAAGYIQEAKEYLQNHDLKVEGTPIAATAWSLHQADMEQEAKDLFAYATTYDNYTENPWMLASNTLSSTAYYYLNGDYDKAIELASVILEEGKESTNEKYFLDRDPSKGFYKNHWTACYELIEKYNNLAQRAKNGETVNFDTLKDGEYHANNTGYILTPISVDVSIKDGKIATIHADQKTEPKDDRSATATQSIPEKIVATQDIKVDTIATATISSESVRISVIESLLEAGK